MKIFLFIITLSLFGCANAINQLIDKGGDEKAAGEYLSGYVPDLDDGINAYNTRDYAAALKIMLPLADKNIPRAEHVLGELYFNGYGVEKDMEKGLMFYRLAAYHGEALAKLKLGFIYENGQAKAQDDPHADDWYTPHDITLDKLKIDELVALANKGNKEAQYLVGRAYRDGDLGVKVDSYLASVWFEKSYESGYWQANLSTQKALKTDAEKRASEAEKKASEKYYEYKKNNENGVANIKKITPYNYGRSVDGKQNLNGGYDPSVSNNIKNDKKNYSGGYDPNDSINKKNEMNASERATPSLDMSEAKRKCLDLGFKPKTEKFGKCVLELSK